MRILGCLRTWYKLVVFVLIFFIQTLSIGVWADSKIVIKSHLDLLKSAKLQSAEYQKIKAQFEVDSLTAQNLVSMYNWSLLGGVTRQNGESPSTSPFSPAGESESTQAHLRLEKQTALGITPFIEMTTSDVFNSFPGVGTVKYQTTSIETGLRLDLMKVIFAGSSSKVFAERKLRDELAVLAQKNNEKNFSVKILKSYFQYLKSYKRFEILKTQCGEYERLQRISSRRFKKNLIREKDYLSIEVLYQGCLLDKKTAENNLALDEIVLIKVSGLPSETLVVLSDAEFPKASSLKGFKLEENLDYQMAVKALDAVKEKALSQKANLYPGVSFDYSLKSQASEDGVGESLSEAMGFDLLTHNLGFNLRYEFSGSAANISAKKTSAEKRIKSLEFEYLKRSLERDIKKVLSNLEFLKDAQLKSLSLVQLQKRKSRLFKKDFKNGRGGIRDLVEAQVNYLNSLERALDFEYNQSLSKIDYYDLKGESFERFN